MSFLMSVGMFLFYREQYFLAQGKIYPIFTFFTYFFLSLSLMLIVSLIVTLYNKKSISKLGYILITLYATIFGATMGLNIIYGTYLSSHILIAIIYAIPLIHLLFYIFSYDKKFYFNVFLLQTFGLFIVFVLKTINIIINIDTISFISPNKNEIGFLTISNIILYTFIISYLLVKNMMINEELNAHKSLIEGSLFHAIKLSEIDSLTGVYNRRKVDEVINHYYEMSNKNKTKFSILMIDINNFKVINDTYGHTIGDKVLVFVADVLKQLLRDNDIISRWGGDEFLVLLPNKNIDNSKIVINEISSFLEHHKCMIIEDYISLSFGASDNSHNVTREEMIDIADKKMYIYKNK
jgi:diguanylate cyclase (GGDEF)-like protein